MTWRDRVSMSGSKWHRAWRCPPSAALPQDTDDDREERTEPARNRGKDVHAYLETVRPAGKEAALAAAPDDLQQLLRSIDIDALPTHLSTEVAFAMNMVTGAIRELGRNLGHRDYASLEWPPDFDELPFTLDVIGVQETDKGVFGYVGDYKTGHTKYPPPDEYGQTLLGALAVRAIYKCTKVVVELIYLDEETGQHYPARRVVDDWDLDIVERSFMKAWQEIDKADAMAGAGMALAFRQGNHCTYCAAYKHCDAKIGLVRSVPEELVRLGVVKLEDGKLEVGRGALTVRNAGEMFLAAENIREVLGRVMTEICGLAWHEPIPLPDGRVIERRETSRRKVDGKKAAALLASRYGQEQAAKYVDIKVSLEQLYKAAAAYKDPKERLETKRCDGVFDKLITELEAMQGIETIRSEDCKPYMPKAIRSK